MTALAAQADVEAELGRTLTDAEVSKLDAALGAASRSVRRVTGRRYEAGTFTVRRRVFDGKVYLDQASSVGAIVHSTYAGDRTLAGWVFDSDEVAVCGLWPRWVKVTYTATGDIPADVVEVCAAMAARRLTATVPQGATSYTTTRGPFSESAGFDRPTEEPTAEELRTLAQFALPRNGPLTLGPSRL